MQKFCVITTGRAASTALMDRLENFDDVAVPSQDIDCRDNELVHPDHIQDYYGEYARKVGRSLQTPQELVEAFFDCHRDAGYAGFKTMYNRHPDLSGFVARKDIQFITLKREDIAATLASFIAAMELDTWRRDGGQPDYRWTFSADNLELVDINLRYLFESHLVLARVPDAIALTYEDLCRPDFQNAALDVFFGRPVALADPIRPTDATQYVTNWSEFEAHVARSWLELGESLRT